MFDSVVGDDLPDLELSVGRGGEGVSPETVDIRKLAPLLIALRKLIAAIAEDPKIRVSLVGIESHSLGSIVASTDEKWPHARGILLDAANDGGATLNPAATEALLEMHDAARVIGSGLAFREANHVSKHFGNFVELKPPVALESKWLRYTTTIYGSIVALRNGKDGGSVSIKPIDDRQMTLSADRDVLRAAHAQFERTVRATIEASPSYGGPINCILLDVEPWDDKNLFEEIERARGQLEQEGIEFDLDAALQDLNDPD